MSRIATTFQQLKSRGEPALITYLMAGDPSMQQSAEYFEALARGGSDIIEIGIPFSDPVADGATIQAAGQRALAANATLESILQMVQNLRSKTQAPLVLMTYFNPVFAYGEDKFLARCQEVGVDGLILPDVPLEEAVAFAQVAQSHNIDIIHLATPATREERLKRMAELTTGFLYLVGRYGVTGSQSNLDSQTRSLIQKVRGVVKNIPLVVGFGLSNADQIRGVIDAGADGGVIGSALVQEVERGILPQLLTEKVRLLKVGSRTDTHTQHQPSQQPETHSHQRPETPQQQPPETPSRQPEPRPQTSSESSSHQPESPSNQPQDTPSGQQPEQHPHQAPEKPPHQSEPHPQQSQEPPPQQSDASPQPPPSSPEPPQQES